MDIVINLEPIINFLTLPMDEMLTRLFWAVGWLPIALAFLWGASQVWLRYVRIHWFRTNKFILLAIDIPRGNLQSPKAVENIFSYLAGAHSTKDLYEKWWLGEIQLSFSFEIVSIDGYIQFLIHTPEKYRNLVESAIYSQYPDAEITEVNDYTESVPTQYPDEQYDCFGGEYIQVDNFTYPIKTYEDFEHAFGPSETHYKDPMAALMDLMSSLKKGEQLWYQIIIIPIDTSWADEGDKEISRIVGEKVESGKNVFDKIADKMIDWLGVFSEMVYKLWGDIEEKKAEKEEPQPFRMMNLKPKQKRQVESIQEKVGKLGFGIKIRYIYVAKKEVMNRNKVAYGFTGYMKQFNLNDLNSIKPDTGPHGTYTKVAYEPLFKDYRVSGRKTRLMGAYKRRDDTAGRAPGIYNIEELATIWHFPIEGVVKAPLIQKAPGRKAEPPASLPISESASKKDSPFAGKSKALLDEIFITEAQDRGPEKETPRPKSKQENHSDADKGAPPSNLPFI